MFECSSDVDLVEVMGEATRDESTSIALRLLAVGELYARRAVELVEGTDPADWVAAEVSTVQNISHARAVGQIWYGRTLRERLPNVAKVFVRGTIDMRLVSAIIARTENVEDDLIAQLDEAIARHCEKWMKLSKNKLRDRIDQWVSKFDPAGVRVTPKVDEGRYIEVSPGASAGMAFANGHIRAEDAAALDQGLDALAATVCEHDPRTLMQRRSDACGPLGRREAFLACECGREDCTAAGERTAASTAVIHVLAEQGTVDGTSDNPGYLRGFGIMPAESVRRVAKSAKLKPIMVPSGADPGYRPSAACKEFVQWRDLTCRWPGCDKPALRSDIDHTVPWPAGSTHASNNKCYCRIHHLIKTFGCWSDQQMPDGTIILTSPTGHVYSTEPHGAAMFPTLGKSTGELDLPEAREEPTDRSAMMPKRRQTRDEDRRDRINAERRERTELIAEEERQRQAWLAANYEPPPF